MGGCMGVKPAQQSSSLPHPPKGPRRKYSVYFPAEHGGKQRYAERECKNNGINFKDIQDIFNGKYKLPELSDIPSGEGGGIDGRGANIAIVAVSSETEVGQSHHQQGQTNVTDQQSTLPMRKTKSTNTTSTIIGQHITAPLKRGEEVENQIVYNKDVFKEFDYNLPDDKDNEFS